LPHGPARRPPPTCAGRFPVRQPPPGLRPRPPPPPRSSPPVHLRPRGSQRSCPGPPPARRPLPRAGPRRSQTGPPTRPPHASQTPRITSPPYLTSVSPVLRPRPADVADREAEIRRPDSSVPEQRLRPVGEGDPPGL